MDQTVWETDMCGYTVGPGELKPPLWKHDNVTFLNAAQNKYVYLFKYHQLTGKKNK